MSSDYRARRLLILGGGAMQSEAYAVARSLGLQAICVDPNPEAPCRALANHFHAADLADVQALGAVAKQYSIEGVMTLAADYPMPALAQLCAELRLTGPSPDAIAIVCDKARLRQATAPRFENKPRWQELSRAGSDGVPELMHQSKCIVKPVDSSGGRGVTQLEANPSPEDVRAAFQAAFAASRTGRLIVEEFVDGPEFSVESFTYRGQTETVAVTEKITSGSPFFMEVGHVVPATLSGAEVESIHRFVAAVVEATGLDDCATHLELKLGPTGPVLIEVAGRLGGGFINTDLVPLATGVNMVKAAIDVALNLRPDLRRQREAAAAIRFLIPPPGRLLSVDGIEAAAAAPETHRIVCDYQPNEVIPVIRDATGRKAYVICSGRTAAEAKRVVDAAAQRVVFRTQRR